MIIVFATIASERVQHETLGVTEGCGYSHQGLQYSVKKCRENQLNVRMCSNNSYSSTVRGKHYVNVTKRTSLVFTFR